MSEQRRQRSTFWQVVPLGIGISWLALFGSVSLLAWLGVWPSQRDEPSEPPAVSSELMGPTSVCHDMQLIVSDVVVCPHPRQAAEVVGRKYNDDLLLCKCER